MPLICTNQINPTILYIDDQQVTFNITDDNSSFCISVVYASTNYIRRRQLWHALENQQNQTTLLWCTIGDYNIILGSQEHKGYFHPTKGPMMDFFDWSDRWNLFHLPTIGVQ